MSGILVVRDRAEVLAYYTRAVEAPSPRRPLLQAAAQGRLRVLGLTDPGGAWPATLLKGRDRPAVVLIEDELQAAGGSPAVGPAKWKCSAKVARWARAVVICTAGGHPDDFRQAVHEAQSAIRVAIIETSQEHVQAWVTALGCRRTHVAMPDLTPALQRQGTVH